MTCNAVDSLRYKLQHEVQIHLVLLHHAQVHTHIQPFVQDNPVSRNQKKHSPTHTNPNHQPFFISFLHVLQSTASSLINSRTWQNFSATSLHVFLGLPLGLAPSTSYSIHFFNNHYLLFPIHALTIAICFDVIPRLCHIILVSLAMLYLELHLLP